MSHVRKQTSHTNNYSALKVTKTHYGAVMYSDDIKPFDQTINIHTLFSAAIWLCSKG